MISQKNIKITLPPSVVAKMPSLHNTNLTETGAIINLEIPLSQLRGQAQHIISPRPGDGSEDVGGLMPPKPPDLGPSSSGVHYSPRLIEPEIEQETPTGSQQSSGGEQDSDELDSGGDTSGAAPSNAIPNPTLRVDMSHTLPTNTTVRRLLTECISPEVVDDLIRGAKIIKVRTCETRSIMFSRLSRLILCQSGNPRFF